MKKEVKNHIELSLKFVPIFLSIVSLIISYKTYASQFEENFVINNAPAKFLYLDPDDQCLVYENEIIITNTSRNSISLILCDIKFSNQSVENNLSNQFPILFSPGEAKKFTYRFHIPIKRKDTTLLSVSQNEISNYLSQNKRYKYSTFIVESTSQRYYCQISLKQD